MVFTKRLREGVRRGKITCSVRIWKRLHVKVGSRYRVEDGHIEVDSITPIGLPDITPQLARESGFLGVVDLLKVAKHGNGENIYLIRSISSAHLEKPWNSTCSPHVMSKLDEKHRDKIPAKEFAFPKEEKEPIHDAAHVRNAIARFNQVKGVSDEEKDAAWKRIKAAAKKHGVDMKETDRHQVGAAKH